MALMSVAPDKVRQATHMLFAAHHLDREGLARGHVEDVDETDHESRGQNHWVLRESEVGQQEERARRNHERGLGDEQDPPLVKAVGDDPAQWTQHQHGQELAG